MKESRLFRIVYYLIDKGHATASELSQEFEVSVRTIYRDIDVLSGVGIPVYAEIGRNGGIYLSDTYVLDKTLFSEKEKLELLAALQSLAVVDNTYEKELLTKLSALFKIQSENWFEVDFSRWGSRTHDNEKFELLKQAVLNHREVVITYVNSNGIHNKRKIQPIKFMFKAKEWYIKAFCTDKQDFRIFKFNRIVELELLEEEFIPVKFPESRHFVSEVYPRLVLRFPRKLAYRVYDEFETDEIAVQADGTFLVSAEMPEDAWLIGYLLSFGTQVEVIEPVYLRKTLAEEGRKIYEKNKG